MTTPFRMTLMSLLGLLLWAGGLPAAAADHAAPPALASTADTATASEAELRAQAADAYFWAYPMANIYARRIAFKPLKEPGLMGGIVPTAPVNRLSMLSDYMDPKERLITCPNQDVIYGALIMALDIEPVVVQVPDFGDRFWVFQAVDLRTDEFAELGKMYGTKPGFYMLVGPDWNGETPKGIEKVFRSQSNTGMMAPRVFQNDSPEDKKAVQAVISQIDAYPLSEFTGAMKTRDWSKLPAIEGAAQSGAGDKETQWVVPEKFFDVLPLLLDDCRPLPGEEARYAQAKALSDLAKADPAKKAIMVDAAKKAEAEKVLPLLQFRNYGIKLPHHWTTVDNSAQFGTDYFTRTAAAKSNILVNRPVETKYFYQDLDDNGQRLNGAHAYTVTFGEDRVPVKGFWSLTLYNEHHFFAPNDLNRFSLGTKNQGLKPNEDGSLTLYVQAENPGPDREANWLPAPKDADFSLYLRAYWPEESVLDGRWLPPAVAKSARPGAMAALAATPEPATARGVDADRFAALADIPFPDGYPSLADIQTLKDEIFFQRAVQSYIWALPALNVVSMKEGAAKFYGPGYNVMAVWKGRLNAKTLVPTPNSDVIYGLAFLDLKKDGPMVVEVPPNLQGILDDFYQRPVGSEGEIEGKRWAGDVGLPGPDKGKGGQYLILPPDHKGGIPSQAGQYVFRSRTYGVMVFWRAFYKDPADLSEPVKLIEQTRIYPWGKKDAAPAMQFPDASNIPADLLYPKDGKAFETIARFIEAEYPDPADMEIRGMLATLGIQKGQPFNPDAKHRRLLDEAAKAAYKYTLAVSYTPRPQDPDGGLWWPDMRWLNVFPGNAEFTAPTFNYIDSRTAFFASAYSASPGMAVTMENVGAKYPTTFMDARGDFLDGGKNYKLTLPKDVPAAIFWSVTAYDSMTSAGLDNGQPFPSINTMDKPAANADGAIDIHFGPANPGEGKNWIRTLPGKGFFVVLRLYGPTKTFFDKTWKPGQVERLFDAAAPATATASTTASAAAPVPEGRFLSIECE